jgi:hypothetical protein
MYFSHEFKKWTIFILKTILRAYRVIGVSHGFFQMTLRIRRVRVTNHRHYSTKIKKGQASGITKEATDW